MSKRHMLAALAALSACVGLSVPARAATLVVQGGILTGATGVHVGGQGYDVAFSDGTCAQLFTGCDNASDFIAPNSQQAAMFAQALLDQVFIDGPQGAFDSNPHLTRGCSDAFCLAWIPFESTATSTHAAFANNGTDSTGRHMSAGLRQGDFTSDASWTWARFTPAALAAVPEPATWAMLLLGFGMVGGAMRLVRRERVGVAYAGSVA